MLKSVTVINYKGEKTVIELGNPEKSGFLITEIEGLGPGKATINMTEISSYDGAVYNSSRLPARNITISFRYLWADTIEEARHSSYRVFPLRKKIKLIFETDERLAAIDGYVESNEPVIFDQASHTQVSIICEDPYFYSYENEGKQSIVFGSSEPAFEFPFFSDPIEDTVVSVTLDGVVQEYLGGLVFGKISKVNNVDCYYTGDVDTGFDLYLRASTDITGLVLSKIYDDTEPDTMTFNDSIIESSTGSPIVEGDLIHICTKKGSKRVELSRDGVVYNIMNSIGRNPKWLALTPGNNTFSYSTQSGLFSAKDIRFVYQILYEGA